MQLVEDKPALKCEPFRPQFVAILDLDGAHSVPLRTWTDFASLWLEVPDAERESLLAYLYDKFCTFGYVGLRHADGFIENAGGKELLAGCLANAVEDWSRQGMALASAFWLFESTGILLTEYNQQPLETEAIERFVLAKRASYLAINGWTGPPDDGWPPSLISVCGQIKMLRASIPVHYVRCFSINGDTWEREERFLDSRGTSQAIYPVVRDAIESHLGIALPHAPGAKESLESFVDIAAANSINPFEILVAIADAALRDSILDADYAVITVPQGRGLDTPWDIRIQDVCSYATVRPDFDPAAEGVEFQRHQIIRAIERRMRHNTACRSKNYHPLREVRRQAQPFQFPDIAIHESSHHLGHIKSGINNSARTHFEIRIPSLAHLGEFRGFGDLRVNRADDSAARRYSFNDLLHLLPYGQWCKFVFDYAIGNGLLMDAKYCTTA